MSLTPQVRCTPPCRIVLGYALAAMLWIFFSDWIIFGLWPEKAEVMNLSLIKGVGFVLFTSIMLYLLLRRNAEILLKAHREETANQLLPVSFDKIFSSTPVIVYVIEFQGKIATPIWVSSNIENIFGYSVDEALTTDWWEFHLHPEDRQRAETKSFQLLSGEGGSHEYRFRRADNDYLYIRDELQLIEEDFHTKTFVGIWTDLSEIHRSQLEIEAYSKRIERTMYNTIDMIAELTELRDPYTAGHEARVGELAAAIAAEMGYDHDFQQGLRVAGILHDVGKIGIPSEILIRPRRLHTAQFDLLKTHAEYSYLLVKNIDFPWPIAETVYQHHERLDGSGYPRGLKGDAVTIEARILAIADVVESMSSHRPYRPAIGEEDALLEIERNAGKLYDTNVAKACLRLFREKNYRLPEVKPDSTFNRITATRTTQTSKDTSDQTTL